MSELQIESTNGGSKNGSSKKVSFVGGQIVVDLKQNELQVPPNSNKEAKCSENPNDYTTIKLINPEQERKSDDHEIE